MQRARDSHKGENGKVAIIGGSRHQHGAPLFSALAAEKSGADLLYVFVPACHEEVAKAASLNFQVHTFGSATSASADRGDEMNDDDIKRILKLLATMDCAVIGPGLSRSASSLKAIDRLIASAPCPLVLDASALQPGTLKALAGKQVVLTPHLGELERMGIQIDNLPSIAKEHNAVILLKSETSLAVSEMGDTHEISGGNAGLTVGGTGDATAGLIAGLMSQGTSRFEACVLASTVIKRAGKMLYETHGYAYGTMKVIECIPGLLHKMD
jgi:ADP-dependent NAD(P)H-hydrate dehydratase / NAD(P)H-hydrate epimerase